MKFYLIIYLLVSIKLIHSNANINPYKVLGISRNSDEKEIKTAYRNLAKHWHPDKNKAPEAHEKFLQINQAYEVKTKAGGGIRNFNYFFSI